MPIKTLKFKIQPDDYAWLNHAARETNEVWNFCNETSQTQAARRKLGENRPLLTGNDLCNLTSGQTEHTQYIGADTIQRVAREFPLKLQQAKDRAFEELAQEKDPEERAKIRRRIGRLMAGKLSWRASGGAHRAPGYVPFKAGSLTATDTGVKFAGRRFRVFELERLAALPEAEGARARPWRDGAFSQDAAGDWYLCLPVIEEVEQTPAKYEEAGIDLGLKYVGAASDGWKVPAPRFYREAEEKLARLQRPYGTDKANKKTRRSKKLTRLHRKVARQRRDFTNKASAKVVKRYEKIALGDVSIAFLGSGNRAKSARDAAVGMFKSQVLVKGLKAGRVVDVIDEKFTTMACGTCRALSGPKGASMLFVREWVCRDCGTWHDRDTNAAENILSRAKVLWIARSMEALNEPMAPVSGYRRVRGRSAPKGAMSRRQSRCGHEAASEARTVAR
jgi:hypothetical protein